MTFSITASTPYAWSGSSFSWTSAEAAKPWWQLSTWVTATNAEDEALALSDALTKAITQALSDGLTLADAASGSISSILVSNVFETLYLVEEDGREVSKALADAFALADAISTQWEAVLEIAEAFTMTDADDRAVVAEHLVDLILRIVKGQNFGGRHADIVIRNSAMDAEEFAARWDKRGPAGWLDFKDFVPADYSYEDAIVWMRVLASDQTTDAFSITKAVLNVDVPDIQERGSASVTSSGGFNVTFSRDFYAPPEVQLTQKGGAGPAICVASNVTADGFTIDCYNATNPAAKMAATVSWSALGY